MTLVNSRKSMGGNPPMEPSLDAVIMTTVAIYMAQNDAMTIYEASDTLCHIIPKISEDIS